MTTTAATEGAHSSSHLCHQWSQRRDSTAWCRCDVPGPRLHHVDGCLQVNETTVRRPTTPLQGSR